MYIQVLKIPTKTDLPHFSKDSKRYARDFFNESFEMPKRYKLLAIDKLEKC